MPNLIETLKLQDCLSEATRDHARATQLRAAILDYVRAHPGARHSHIALRGNLGRVMHVAAVVCDMGDKGELIREEGDRKWMWHHYVPVAA